VSEYVAQRGVKGMTVNMTETQETVCAFADEKFGPATSNIRVAARANEEMAELLRALSADDNHPKAAEEIADVVIILYRLARNLGTDLQDEIDRKMAINRKRTWKRDETGHGYHVRDKGKIER
jgi:NTP pyrophosphatase (non-canonical NTP hydrolase)